MLRTVYFCTKTRYLRLLFWNIKQIFYSTINLRNKRILLTFQWNNLVIMKSSHLASLPIICGVIGDDKEKTRITKVCKENNILVKNIRTG